MQEEKSFHEVNVSPARFKGYQDNKLTYIVWDSPNAVNTGEPLKIWEEGLSDGCRTGSFVLRVVTKSVRMQLREQERILGKTYILTLEAL